MRHAHLVVLMTVAREIAALCEEHEVVGAVPLLDDVEPSLISSLSGSDRR